VLHEIQAAENCQIEKRGRNEIITVSCDSHDREARPFICEDYNDEKRYIESRNKTAKPYYKLHIILVLIHTTYFKLLTRKSNLAIFMRNITDVMNILKLLSSFINLQHATRHNISSSISLFKIHFLLQKTMSNS